MLIPDSRVDLLKKKGPTARACQSKLLIGLSIKALFPQRSNSGSKLMKYEKIASPSIKPLQLSGRAFDL